MSSWQRLHESDSMKNLLGILSAPFTWAELGKNAPCGPSPSSFMLAGGIEGFLIRERVCHVLRTYHDPTLRPANTVRHTMPRTKAEHNPRPIQPRFPSRSALSNATPARHSAMCR